MIRLPDRQALSWAFYDWANSAFATTVMAGFFPLFFKEFWSAGVAVTESTWRLGMANSAAGLAVALSAPLLGAIADRGGAKKRLLAFFLLTGTLPTLGLYFVGEGEWLAAAALYAVGVFGFSSANTFYDSLLVAVARKEERDRVSALGYSLGYLGGGLLFAVNVAMALQPALFGLADGGEAVRLSFVMVAGWWLLFALPLLRFVEEPRPAAGSGGAAAVAAGLRQFAETFHQLRRLKPVWLFLLAYWLYIDGVDTVIRMAVDFGLSLGFASSDLITALLITQFVGFPAALAYGRLGERIGTRPAIIAGIGVYVGVTLWAARMEAAWEFYTLAVIIGLAQGGVQALSRSLYSRLIPPHQAAEFFGFYNMLGKFAVVLGPLLMGAVAAATGDARSSIYAVTGLLVLGAVLLTRVEMGRTNDDQPTAARG
ncbi:MFS transporter [Endothiovibrio diazotrophicus]